MGVLRRLRDRVTIALHGQTYLKEKCEFRYWRERKNEQGELKNGHYAYFYTSYFGFEEECYRDRRVLDIGCGPRGSLEWATMAKERVGLDPLVDAYRELGIDAHGMDYACAPAEAIPFPDGHFDIVTSFNSLDHVEDLDRTLAEIRRVTKPGGWFLLITEVNHEPRPCEPITFSFDLLDRLRDAFDVVDQRAYEDNGRGVYSCIHEDIRFDEQAEPRDRPAWMTAKLRRR
jgi:SAM-dependent methyltransferase